MKKPLFQGKKCLVGLRGIAMLCIFQLSFLFAPAHSQEQNHGNMGNRKILYGLHLGFTENRVDLYHTQGGEAHALEQGNHSFYVPGFRIAVLTDMRLGRCFSLRIMPGIATFSRNWDPEGVMLPSVDYKVESILGELPIDVKFHPFRKGNWQPYLCAGLHYGIDFVPLRKDVADGNIQRLNAHDLRYTCGLGLDCDTPYLRIGMEMKASIGLLSPSTSGYSNPVYFHSGPTFMLGFNIEA